MKLVNRRSFMRNTGLVATAVGMAVTARKNIAHAETVNVTAYPDIPRIEVHSHVSNDFKAIENYHRLRDLLVETYKTDLAFWINLGDRNHPIPDIDSVTDAGKGRMLCCISDYSAHDGLDIPPDDLPGLIDRGFIGYKIWSGPPHRRLNKDETGYPYIDNPAHEPTFAKMEEEGIVVTSIHIADPNGPWGDRTKWLPDPVEYWKEINAWRNVLERHPNLISVAAHGCWSLCQDAQIDYMRNLLATFPNFNIDLAATFQYFYMVTRDNLRDFMIEYGDRILFGTDVGRWDDPERTVETAQRYFQCFEILETDKMIAGGFFSQNETKGLDLPRETLEKIYFRNAMRLYPHVKDSMRKLGYNVG